MNERASRCLGLAVAFGLLAGAACLPAPTLAASAPKSCFWTRSINGFASPDDKVVYVRVNGRDVYELKLFAPCLGVSWSRGIGLRTRGSSSVCEGTGNWVEIYAQSGGMTRKCSVSEVRKLTADDVAALPKGAPP